MKPPRTPTPSNGRTYRDRGHQVAIATISTPIAMHPATLTRKVARSRRVTRQQHLDAVAHGRTGRAADSDHAEDVTARPQHLGHLRTEAVVAGQPLRRDDVGVDRQRLVARRGVLHAVHRHGH